MSLSIYKLEKFHDDPRYVEFEGNFVLPGWIPARKWKPGDTLWKPARFAATWRPLKVTGRVRKFNDYPCLHSMPAFSERAVNVLRDFLELNCELLPLRSELGAYFACNVTTIADVLNVRRSKIDLLEIWRYEFFARRLKGLSIFRIPQEPLDTYVTQEFVERAHEHGLRGMDFQKVWPFPRTVDWWRVAVTQTQKQKQHNLPREQSVKGHTLTISFNLLSKTSKGSPAEKKRIGRLMNELDALLVDPLSTLPAVGHVEGYDRSTTGKWRLLLSCPDANELARMLQPWLKQLSWPGGFSVGKRFANFSDVGVPTIPVKIK